MIDVCEQTAEISAREYAQMLADAGFDVSTRSSTLTQSQFLTEVMQVTKNPGSYAQCAIAAHSISDRAECAPHMGMGDRLLFRNMAVSAAREQVLPDEMYVNNARSYARRTLMAFPTVFGYDGRA